jgi:hypothetical protein
LLAKGLEKEDIRRALAERLAARVGISSGPSGPDTTGITPTTPKPLPPFVPSAAAKAQRMATVWVDVLKLDEAFQRDVGFAITRSGAGAIPGRIEGFKQFFKRAQTEGIAIEQSQVVVNKDGGVSFINGRHRFSVLRDRGVKQLPVSVPRGQVNRVKKFFGVEPPEGAKFQSANATATATAPLPESTTAAAKASTAPILPGRPIAERIAAWDEGREKIRRLAAIGSEAATARQAVADHKGRVENLAAAYKDAPKGAAKKAAKSAKEEAEAELLRLQGAALRAEKEAREKAQLVLDAPRRLHLGLTDPTHDRLSDHQLDSTREGMRWLQRCVSHPEGMPPMELDIAGIPDGGQQRSHCGRYGMWLDSSVDPRTAVHEIGHHFDFHVPGFDRTAREYLAHRVGDEPAVLLRDVSKGKYRPDETGRKDKFEDAFGETAWYVGKAYDDGMTEITSMGLEQMFVDPAGFARKDPDYAVLILGLMHGALR